MAEALQSPSDNDAELVRDALLQNGTRLLSLLQEEDGTPLVNIQPSDVQDALTLMGQPEDIVSKVGAVLERSFPRRAPTPRELISFIRFGVSPQQRQPTQRPAVRRPPRRPVPLDRNLVSLYERGAGHNTPSLRIRLKAPMSKLPAVTLTRSPSSACSVPPMLEAAYLPRSPGWSAQDALASPRDIADGHVRPIDATSSTSLPKLAPGSATETGSAKATASRKGRVHVSASSPGFGKSVRSKTARDASSLLCQGSGRLTAGANRIMIRPSPSAEVTRFIDELRAQLRDRKMKVMNLLAKLDLDGDGQLDRNELRIGLINLVKDLNDGEESEGLSDQVLEQVLDAFDSDGSGTVDAQEFARTLWGRYKFVTKRMQAGGVSARKWATSSNRNSLRTSIEDLSIIGAKLTSRCDGLTRDELKENLRIEVCKHAMALVRTFSGDRPVHKHIFLTETAKLFGMRPLDVGKAAADALRRASAQLFDEWDLAKLEEMELTELMKVLRKGGRITIPKRARRDAIFQAEISAYAPKEERVKENAISLAKQALHGFVIQTREEQLHSRAERVAPVQLEALLHKMADDSNNVLDLFLKWDANGDGTVCEDEFASAVAHLGFRFSKEVCATLFKFFDKDDGGSVTLEEIEQTLAWGRERKAMRPLLAGWRQLTLDNNSDTPLHEQIRQKLNGAGKHPIEFFKNWDESGNGTLDRTELGQLMTALGGMTLSPGELDKLFDSFDKDGSGQISFKELQKKLRQEVPVEQLMDALADKDTSAKLFEMFTNHWDLDGDGVLDKEEFAAAMKSIGVRLENESALDDLFNMLDEDLSGTISLKELEHSLRWINSCNECQKLRTEAYNFGGTLTIQQQIKRALAANSVRVLDLFREWDADGDGVVDEKEFCRAMPLLGIHAGKSEVEELFRALDHDGDGIIAFKEFNRLMRRAQEDMQQETERDPFGQVVATDWRPVSPHVSIVDVGNLRDLMRTEHRLRKLDSVPLHGVSV